ncbi:MAG: hypothetical protein HYT62_01020 [Candidatus Yanofskybacteria bacterium]|nr:hypothetical protein [Candidatus Yanofskybacteria bacterium]
MRNVIKNIFFAFLTLLFPIAVFALTPTPPAGVDIVLDTCTTPNCISLLNTAQSIAGWLIIAGGILASITIVGTGIMYLMSGGNPTRMTDAKNMFKAGIVGALIIFSPGMIIGIVTGFGSNPLGFFGSGGTGSGTGVTYGCNSNNQCVQMAGGIFTDSTCASQCTGVGGQSISGACYSCTNQGKVWCLATATCITNELNCPGVFTKVAGGCP